MKLCQWKRSINFCFTNQKNIDVYIDNVCQYINSTSDRVNIDLSYYRYVFFLCFFCSCEALCNVPAAPTVYYPYDCLSCLALIENEILEEQ